MEEFLTITELLRNQLLDNYNSLKQDFFDNMDTDDKEEIEDFELDPYEDNIDDQDLEEDLDIDDNIIDEMLEDNEDDYEDKVIFQLMGKISNSKYKNIIYLIILQDVYEYIKTKQISELKLFQYETDMLEFLSIWDVNVLFKKIESSYEFYLDLITLYFEYHFENSIENRIKNRKLIELSNNKKNLEKFKICDIDNLQYQYIKRRL